MRVHVQNPTTPQSLVITPALWEAALARAGGDRGAHETSFADDAEGLAAGLRDAELLVGATGVLARILPVEAPRLRLIFTTSAGVERLPLDRIPAHVTLLNNSGTHAEKAGEYAAMALLMLANHMPEFATAQRAGRWAPHAAGLIRGRRLTVLGLGSLGGAAAEWGAKLGLTVHGVRGTPAPHPACMRVVGLDGLDALLPETDFLFLALPLTPATEGVLDRRRIGLLPKGAGVVNIGRGALIEQDALCDALDAGRLAGAILDVATPEPLPEGHRLWSTPNLIITPHMSCDDPDSYVPRSLDILFENLQALQDGRSAPNAVDRARGY